MKGTSTPEECVRRSVLIGDDKCTIQRKMAIYDAKLEMISNTKPTGSRKENAFCR